MDHFAPEGMSSLETDFTVHAKKTTVFNNNNINNNTGVPGHVAGAGDYLVVVKKPTARQVAVVAGQLATDSDVSLACLEAVDGADVVQASAGDEVARRSVGARHHPARAQRNRVQLPPISQAST